MPEQMTAVTHDLRCVKCGFVLRGLPVTGYCPDCNTIVMHTLVETIDIPSQALARPIHARRVARAMLAVAVGILLWTVGTTAPMTSRGILVAFGSSVPGEGAFADRLGVIVGFLGVLMMTIGSLQLTRRDDKILRSETGRADRWLLTGVGIWIVAAGASVADIAFGFRAITRLSADGPWFACLAVELIGATIASVGLRKFTTVLGRRCRRFRHAGNARQSIETMVVAGAIALVAALGGEILPRLDYPDAAFVARIVSFITGGLLLMGAIYLVINFGWIHRILSNPPPQLEDVVRVVLPLGERDCAN